MSIHHPYHHTAGAATAEDMQWIKAVKIRDEGFEDMIELQEGDGAESNAEKSVVEDGSDESEDDKSDQVSTFDEEVGELLTLAAQIMAVIGMKPAVANHLQSTSNPRSGLRTCQLHSRKRKLIFCGALMRIRVDDKGRKAFVSDLY
jgi:hypothetical protein